MTYDHWKTSTDADFFGSTHPRDVRRDDTTPPDFLPGDRVYNTAAHAYATVVNAFKNAHGKDRVLIVYTDGVGGGDTQPYSISPYWLKPLED